MSTFELIQITPVGFKQPIYPHSNCKICRGPLIEVCIDCKKINAEICLVISDPESNSESISYYHEHCFKLLPAKK